MTDAEAVTTTATALRRTNSHRRRQQRGSSSIITSTPPGDSRNNNSQPTLLAKIMHQRLMMMMMTPYCGTTHFHHPSQTARSRTCSLVLMTTITFFLGSYIFAFVFEPIIIEEPTGGGGTAVAKNHRPEEEEGGNIRFLTHNYGWATLRLKLMANEEENIKNTVRTGPWHSATVFVPFPASSDNDGHYHHSGKTNKRPAFSSSCRPSSFALRLISDDAALVGILLQEEEEPSSSSSHREDGSRRTGVVWRGNFTIPLPGTYAVEFRWWWSDDDNDNGCGDDNGAMTTGTNTGTGGILLSPLSSSTTTGTALSFIAVGPPATVPQQPDDDHTASLLFANSVWMSQKLLPNSFNNNNNNDLGSSRRGSSDYIWANPLTAPSLDQAAAAEEYLHLKNVGTVAKHGTWRPPHEMYRFDELGNYELVCFWGGTIMHRIRELFLHEKNILSKGQRPFKFHYYNITRFQPQPDADWSSEDKERCRKCKHIFVSLDDIIINNNNNRNDDDNNNGTTLSSQVEFEAQLVAFVLHLQQLMNDATFPIWILTTTTTVTTTNGPTTSSNRACHEQRKYPRSTDHPCNDVLKALFRRKQQQKEEEQGQLSSSRLLFQPRVHLMDNTDLTLPLRMATTLHPEDDKDDDDDNNNNNMHDLLLANIALRIFVAVGKGVADWRHNGQQGLIDGLHRNGTVEPNFVLVPYNWSSVVP